MQMQVHVGGTVDLVESMANITELHDALHFDRTAATQDGAEAEAEARRHHERFGIWSVAWSPAGGEIIAGTNDRSV